MHKRAARTQVNLHVKRGVLLAVYMVNDSSYTQTHVLIVTRQQIVLLYSYAEQTARLCINPLTREHYIMFLDPENMSIDTKIMPQLFPQTELLTKEISDSAILKFKMAASTKLSNLIINSIIIVLDPENIGIDTKIVFL